jgi:hypothetical protein
MKKASFFIVLGLAVLLLFGCAGGGGPLGGVSEKPEGTWFVQLLKEQLNIYYPSNYFYIEIIVNATNDGYVAKAVDEEGTVDTQVTVTFDFDKDKVKELEIKKGSDYDFILTGEFYDGKSSKREDLMFGEYEKTASDEKGVWFAVRKDSSYLAGVSTDEGYSLGELEDIIKGLIEETTGKSVEIDLSELMK